VQVPQNRSGQIPDEQAMDILAGVLLEEGVAARSEAYMLDAEHTFSHIHWNLKVYRCREEEQLLAAETKEAYQLSHPEPEEDMQGAVLRWIGEEDMALYAFPNVFLKILREYFKKH
jgi:A/G-specific adenine glycosylase